MHFSFVGVANADNCPPNWSTIYIQVVFQGPAKPGHEAYMKSAHLKPDRFGMETCTDDDITDTARRN
jgi:hypothetical protein